MKNIKLNDLYIKLNMHECPPEFNNLPLNGYIFEVEDAKGAVVLAHGMAEHAARYSEMGEYYNKYGLNFYAFDYYGHGYSKHDDERVGLLRTNNLIESILFCMKMTHDYVKSLNDTIPMYLFAHSMGSMCAQRYIELYPNDYDKVILSGTDIGGFKYKFLKAITKPIIKAHGYNCYNDTIKKLTLDSFDNHFKKEKTSLAWLSLNKENIETYKNDPLCGEVYPVGYFNSLAENLNQAWKVENIKKIQAKKILLITGIDDPVSNFSKSPIKLNKKYQKLGINSNCIVFENARHESFNEKEETKEKVFETITNFYLED